MAYQVHPWPHSNSLMSPYYLAVYCLTLIEYINNLFCFFSHKKARHIMSRVFSTSSQHPTSSTTSSVNTHIIRPADSTSSLRSRRSSSRQVVTIIDNTLIPAEVANSRLMRNGSTLSIIRASGSISAMGIKLVQALGSLKDADPSYPPVIMVPGYADISPRNLFLIASNLDFIATNQDEIAQTLAQRFTSALRKIVTHMNLLGTVVWISPPPSCPAYLDKPHPIPAVLHQANLIVQRAIRNLNFSQHLPEQLLITTGLYTTMIKTLQPVGDTLALKQAKIVMQCQNFLPNRRYINARAKTRVYIKLSQAAREIHMHHHQYLSCSNLLQRPAVTFRVIPSRHRRMAQMSSSEMPATANKPYDPEDPITQMS